MVTIRDVTLQSQSLKIREIMYRRKFVLSIQLLAVVSSTKTTNLIMYNRQYTPNWIDALQPNEVFVFGSNLEGMHGGGAAWTAYKKFGAIWGQGNGMQGQSYGIPTMHGGTRDIQPYVTEFIQYAKDHPDKKFLVTLIGCGVAGFTPSEIAPLFKDAIDVENIILPKEFTL